MGYVIVFLVSLIFCMALSLAAGFVILHFQSRAKEAEAKVSRAESNARSWALSIQEQAKIEVAKAKQAADEAIRRTQPLMKYQEIEDAHQEATRVLANANENASAITKAAEDRLSLIGNEVGKQEALLTALTNQIKGYGDEYLVPSHSLFDDLAEDFSHKNAGVEFKQARAASEWLVKSDKAAACEYADAGRRLNAIHFVLDAFNGKADSILSRVKEDNFGKLRQELIDAFHTVNSNGKAFREARITEAYLESRQNELLWASRVQELKRIEREEQRAIREQMREEEKARREYEKAIREAEKEERVLQKAMDQARRQMEVASESERRRFEQQLADLQQKVVEAEERNQRAISMAQQTRRGHVYVISNVGSFGDDVFKIGLTRRLDPGERVRELGDASVPFSFDVHAMLFSEDAPALEAELQSRFRKQQVNRVNPRKEFFRLPLTEIKGVVAEMGLEAHWTMKAEAKEYRESIEMERRDKADNVVVASVPPMTD